jgi:hypothetical protein
MDLSPLCLPHKIDKKEIQRLFTYVARVDRRHSGFMAKRSRSREWIDRPYLERVCVNEDMVLGPVPDVTGICV